MSEEGIPNAMQWQIKRLKVLQKETVTMTPNKTTDVTTWSQSINLIFPT